MKGILILFCLLGITNIHAQSIIDQSLQINFHSDDDATLTLRNLEAFPTINFKSSNNLIDGINLYYADFLNRFVIRDDSSPGFGLRIIDQTGIINIDPGSIGRNTIPDRNSLYGNTIIKAWAHIENESISDGVNLSIVTEDEGAYRLVFHTPMSNNIYAAVVSGTNSDFTIFNQTVDDFWILTNSYSSAQKFSVIVVGDN